MAITGAGPISQTSCRDFNMRRILLSLGLALFVSATATAQTDPAAIAQIDPEVLPSSKLACPASGYAPPQYGIVGRNAGDGPAPTEAMSPCTPIAVRDAANAIGMARSQNGSPLTLKALVTALFTAQGTFAVDGKTPRKIDKLDMHIHFGLPAARLMIEAAGKKDIRVFNDEAAWRETSEGMGATKADDVRRDLLVLTKLNPFGAMWSVIEAEGHASVRQVNGQTEIRGTSPHDGLDVTILLDKMNRPQTVQVKDGSTTFGAVFSEYRDDFEPAYLLVFPRRITWTKNGKPYADLTVSDYKSNPYVVFPIPQAAKK